MVDGKTLTEMAKKTVNDDFLTFTLNDKSFQDFCRILIMTTFGTAKTKDENWFHYTFGCKVDGVITSETRFVNVHVRTLDQKELTHDAPREVM